MIGYYIHHHGNGHLNRALAITRHIRESVVFFSSLPRPLELMGDATWVRLPMDTTGPGETPADEDARGRLHWAPLHVRGLTLRSAILLQVIAASGVRRVVVDVSVEVAVLIRLAGVPVTVMAMPGDRADAAHRMAYDLADQIIAPWAAEVYQPEWLSEHRDRTHFVGAISRFEGRTRPGVETGRQRSAVVLLGRGGTDIPADAPSQLRAALPSYRWTVAGGSTWLADPWPLLATADLVITHGGQNALADCAHAEATTIVVPQDRPYNEQRAMADALGTAGIAVTLPSWPTTSAWPEHACRAIELGPNPLRRLRVAGASARAAQVLAA